MHHRRRSVGRQRDTHVSLHARAHAALCSSRSVRARPWLTAFDWRAFAIAEPIAGHKALAQIAQAFQSFRVITPNIDNLHPPPAVPVPAAQYAAVHGRAGKFRCTGTGKAGACPVQEVDLRMLSYGPQAANSPLTIAAVPRCSYCPAFLLPEALLFDEDYKPAVWNQASEWLASS